MVLKVSGPAYVNVKSQLSPSELLFLVDDHFQHPITANLPSLEDEFTLLSSKPGGQAVDFIRGNLFDRSEMRLLPPNLPGPDNDLSDRIEHYVTRAIQEMDARVYAFGERWGSEGGRGVVYGRAGAEGRLDDCVLAIGVTPGSTAHEVGPRSDLIIGVGLDRFSVW